MRIPRFVISLCLFKNVSENSPLCTAAQLCLLLKNTALQVSCVDASVRATCEVRIGLFLIE
jgi:hypothetical protein